MNLGDICRINPAPSVRRDDELVSFIPMSAVSGNGKIERHETRTYAEVKKGYTYFSENDVIMAKITPCFENGKAALATNLINETAYGSTEFHVFRADKNCLPMFLFQQIYRPEIRKTGTSNMEGNAGQKRVPSSFFQFLPFFLPSLKEQQKIAACLSSMDDLIAAQTEKTNTLKTQKTALLQQLFPIT